MHWSDEARRLAGTAAGLTVGRIIANQAVIRPDATAVAHPDGEMSFAEIHEQSNRLAHALLASDVGAGDRIAVLTENSVELCVLLYAAAKVGAAVAVLNWRLRPDELGYCIDLVEAKIVCCSAARSDQMTDALKSAATTPLAIALGSVGDAAESETLLGRAAGRPVDAPAVAVDPESIVTIMYTSGTTGLPKAAAISHRALIARAGVMAAELRLCQDDAFIGWAPMFHMVSTDYMFITHVYGGKFVAVPGFDAKAIVEILLADRVGWFVLMPATITPIIEELERVGRPVRGVRAVGAMADLVPPEHLARLTELLDAPYFNSFGSTEAGTVPSAGSLLTAGVAPVDFAKLQSAFCDVMVVDADGRAVQSGEVGELIMRGPTMFSGYWNDDVATRAVFSDGWYRSGDLFSRTSDGRLSFVARSRYMIKSGGENIYPAEIERVLMQHPSVVEVVVVRRSDARWGEVPVAVVALSDDSTTSNVLAEFCADNLAGYKRPKDIHIRAIDEFPRNVTGKVMREVLEREVADVHAGVSA
jgi:acyl-CoA synthetase (AMP-forming)/AMP-acid ligase II